MENDSVSNSLMGPLDVSGYAPRWSAVSLLDERRIFRLFTAVRGGRRLVVKSLRDEYASSAAHRGLLEREAALGVRLDHPNIVRVDGIEDVDGIGRCIVMERVDGTTLSDYLRSGNPTVGERRRIAAELADALAYAHEMGVSHRDLKPDNVMVTRRGHVKVIDFGLGDADDFISGKESLGSRSYGAPEQQTGSGTVDAAAVDMRADVWSFGRLLEDLNCGRGYASLASRCRREDPDLRPSMSEVADRLERMKRRPSQWPIVIGGVMMAVAAGLLIWVMLRPREQVVLPAEGPRADVPEAVVADTVVRIDSVFVPVRDTVAMPMPVAGPAGGGETPAMAAVAERVSDNAVDRFRHIFKEYDGYVKSHDITEDYAAFNEKAAWMSREVDKVYDDFERQLREAGFAEYRIREIRSGLMAEHTRIFNSR